MGLCLPWCTRLRIWAVCGQCVGRGLSGVGGAGQPPSLGLSGAAFPAWVAEWPLPLPMALCQGCVPLLRLSPWGGDEWEPHGGAARNRKAFGKGSRGWERGSHFPAVSAAASIPAPSTSLCWTPTCPSCCWASLLHFHTPGTPSAQGLPVLVPVPSPEVSHSLSSCLAEINPTRQRSQLASVPGQTQACARSQLPSQPWHLGSQHLRLFPCSSRAHGQLILIS